MLNQFGNEPLRYAMVCVNCESDALCRRFSTSEEMMLGVRDRDYAATWQVRSAF